MSDVTEKPARRGRKPAAATKDKPVTETPQTVVEEPKTPAKTAEARTNVRDDFRIIPKGDAIDVKVDDNGIALETVYQEIALMGTDKVSYTLVARQGMKYKK
jgi:hypothetical protein